MSLAKKMLVLLVASAVCVSVGCGGADESEAPNGTNDGVAEGDVENLGQISEAATNIGGCQNGVCEWCRHQCVEYGEYIGGRYGCIRWECTDYFYACCP